MPTLRDIKKGTGITNAAIGASLGKSATVVGSILRGQHLRVMHDSEIEQLATVLGITFERCWLAMIESYEEYTGCPRERGDYKRADEVKAEVYQSMGLPIQSPRELAVIDCQVIQRQLVGGV